jgi:prepilin-type processing-associated H-X9-DG protein
MPRDRIALLSGASWSSTPADRHSRGCNLTFADGHIEYWKWNAAKSVPATAIHQLDRNQAKDLMRLQVSVPIP